MPTPRRKSPKRTSRAKTRTTRRRDFYEAQQAATAEILQIIARSSADVQPVFDAIAASAVRLLEGFSGAVTQRVGDMLHLVALTSTGKRGDEAFRSGFPVAISADRVITRAAASARAVIVADTEAPGYAAEYRLIARKRGFRSALAVPMVHNKSVLGTISVTRVKPGGFDPHEVRLLSTFADQAVIAIENARLFNETKEALEKQTATAEILRVLSGKFADTGPVFEAIVRNAAKLCDSVYANVFRYDGERLHLAASEGVPSEVLGGLKSSYPMEPSPSRVSGRVILSRRVVRVEDTRADPTYDKSYADTAHLGRVLGIPLLRAGEPVGAIAIGWAEPGPIVQRHEDLLQTFADQAVIAIENVRLFNETKEALERQTATSSILAAISSSPTDLRPVFDAILDKATALCEAHLGLLHLYDGERFRTVAHRGDRSEYGRWVFERGSFRPEAFLAQLVAQRKAVHIADIRDTEAYRAGKANAVKMADLGGGRSFVAVPLLKRDELIGSISVYRPDVRPFTDKQIALVSTFADQAVIAIENARLFNETKEALERQTATAEILRVIASSPADVQPVFDVIASSAMRLIGGRSASVMRLHGEQLHLEALTSTNPAGDQALRSIFPRPLREVSGLTGEVIASGKSAFVEDTETLTSQEFREISRARGHRSFVAVPMLRDGASVGAIAVTRERTGSFSRHEVLTLETFADQAVIAIENVRLFNETKEALEQQKAAADVLSAISGSIADTKPVFDKILESCERLFEGNLVGVTLAAGKQVELAAYRGEHREALARIYPMPLSRESGTGCAILDQRVAHFPDVREGAAPPQVVRGSGVLGFKAIIFAPMSFEGRGIGAIWVARAASGPFSDKQVALLKTFADQAVIAIQNARLFRQIQEKSAQLEVANRHKSEFLANMSHELRTPLNAIIGFSEVLLEKMFGEVNEKQLDYLKDIHDSGKHLLSLINDILDLSKIEAGRMELELSRFHLPSAIGNALTLVRERAQRHGIQLAQDIDARLGEFEGDERKVKQILLNLLSNAVKFTPDGGHVDVSAKLDTDKIEIAVRDTGVGIAPEDQAALFEEFRQVGDSGRKAEGTGLGLALTKKFVELHGGAIRVQSSPGSGSTFTVSLPLR